VRKLGGCDLVICGEKTVDGDTGQVGPEMAEWLGIPHVSYVRQIVDLNGRLKVLCDMSDGLHIAEARLPVLITVTRRAYRPRYATPQRIFKAVTASIERWGADDLRDVASADHFGVKGSPTRVTKIVVPPVEGRKGERLAGSPAEAVATLVKKLETGGAL
jgi:electron transfer flavoprotein beta subunit